MHSASRYGGSFEIEMDNGDHQRDDDNPERNEWDPAAFGVEQSQDRLDEIKRGWRLAPQHHQQKDKKYVNLGCVVLSPKAFKWTVGLIVVAFLVVGLPIIITKTLLQHKPRPLRPDNYTPALHKALLFFDAQKSRKLPKNNDIPWRGNSGLNDGSDQADLNLVGGYYDAGYNGKFHFPMLFAMTMLSWSLNEYHHKYETTGEYNHARDLIKWGTDYLLKTFDSSASRIDKIYAQVGGGAINSQRENDFYCWQKPEDMDYKRPTQVILTGPDLAGDMAAAFAAASIVFRNDKSYSTKLIKGAEIVFAFARDLGKQRVYSQGNEMIARYYNSTGYFDEYIWGAAWLYYATGKKSYLSLVTDPEIARNSTAFYGIDYILGKNPMEMSYVVGFGSKFPTYVHHRGASTPNDGKSYSCTGGWKWRDSTEPNPNNSTGAMVGGPDHLDQFKDSKRSANYAEQTMAGSAGLIAALASLTNSGGLGGDNKTIFSANPLLHPKSPPPPAPWRP